MYELKDLSLEDRTVIDVPGLELFNKNYGSALITNPDEIRKFMVRCVEDKLLVYNETKHDKYSIYRMYKLQMEWQ